MTPRLWLALAVLPASLAWGHLAAAQTADPPGRVGRVALVSGTVSYRFGPDLAWQPAVVNLPVTVGTGLWTEPGAGADLGIGGIRLAADERTELDVTRLDDVELDVTAPQGRLCLHPSSLPRGTAAVVQTPRAAVRITAAGRYEIVAGDTDHPTGITVLDGSARVTGPAIDVVVGANQTATIDGDGTSVPYRIALGIAVRSPFLDACLRRERPAAAHRPAVVTQMSGWEALDEYGSWTPTPQYGAVWFPRDDPAYVPYRAGHWIFVAPWGWTWVDEAAWGFAPSHYGRWVQLDNRWGWVATSPGLPPGGRPVYAPAVVGFLGGAAIGALVGAPGGGPTVGWVPLGPREAYYPPYRVSNTYVRNVNVTNVQNVSTVIQSFNHGGGLPPGQTRSFVNAGAATVAPGAAVQAGQPIAPVARPLPLDTLQRATPGQPPQAPAQAPVLAAAPGPGITDAPRGGRPVLRRPGGSQTPPAVNASPAAPPAPPALERNPAASPVHVPEAIPRPAATPAAPEAEHRPVPTNPSNNAVGAPALRAPEAARPTGTEPASAPVQENRTVPASRPAPERPAPPRPMELAHPRAAPRPAPPLQTPPHVRPGPGPGRESRPPEARPGPPQRQGRLPPQAHEQAPHPHAPQPPHGDPRGHGEPHR